MKRFVFSRVMVIYRDAQEKMVMNPKVNYRVVAAILIMRRQRLCEQPDFKKPPALVSHIVNANNISRLKTPLKHISNIVSARQHGKIARYVGVQSRILSSGF
jgi:hypothetical protein